MASHHARTNRNADTTSNGVDLAAALVTLRTAISAVAVDLLGGGQLAALRWIELADILTEAARLCRERGSGQRGAIRTVSE